MEVRAPRLAMMHRIHLSQVPRFEIPCVMAMNRYLCFWESQMQENPCRSNTELSNIVTNSPFKACWMRNVHHQSIQYTQEYYHPVLNNCLLIN